MSDEAWYLSTDGEMFDKGPYGSREEALVKGPPDIDAGPGGSFWVGRSIPAASRISASTLLEALDDHAYNEGPEGNDGYDVSHEARADLQTLLSAWAEKWDIRPTWFDIDSVSKHTAPTQPQEPAPAESP